ncbi:hypothetical protein PG997_001886 [Apiospora hydei]|uniref:Ankyrin n=1 Tax=Apiospora hydei TaxID=1337664 RepID=A0ABR1X7T6_9PEZI
MSDLFDLDNGESTANRIYQLISNDDAVGVRVHMAIHPDIKKWIIVRPDGLIHHAAIPFAASVGSLEVLRVLMAAAGETDWAPSLYRACRNGQVKVARWILDNHIDAAAESLGSDRPHGSLLLSTLESCPPRRLEVYPEVKIPGHIWRPRQEEVVHLLLDRGANIHDKRYRSSNRFTDNVELLNPGWDVPLDFSDQDALDLLLARDGNTQGFSGEWGNPGWNAPAQSFEPEKATSPDIRLEPTEPIEETALTLALSFGSGHLISRLIDGGCDIHVQVRQFQDTEEGELTEDVTPLHLACHYKNIAGVRLLLQAGGSDAKSMIEARDSNGMTPFHWTTLDAAMFYPQGEVWEGGHLAPSDKMKACSELLLACDSTQLDAQDRWGKTALHYASLLESADVARLLLDRNADPNVNDEEGCTPLFTLLSRSYMPSTMNRQLSPNDLGQFFQHGAELQGVDANGNTLLHLAARCWRWKGLLQWLRQHNLSDDYGDTFVRSNNALRAQDEMVRMLTEAGAGDGDMDRPDVEGRTPRQALASCRKRADEAFRHATFSRVFAECEELEHRQFRLGYSRLPTEIQKLVEDETTVVRGRVNTYHLRHHVSIGRGHANPTRGTGRFQVTWNDKPRRHARPRGRSLELGGSQYI